MDTGTHHLQELLTRTHTGVRPSKPHSSSETYSRESLLLRLNGRSSFRTSISPEESKFLHEWNGTFPTETYGAYLLSWHRALVASGTPVSFIDNSSLLYDSVEIQGKRLQCIALKGALHYEERNRLIKKRAPYRFERPIDFYDSRLQKSCPLCQHVAEAQDSQLLNKKASGSVILSLGDHVLLPNRFPTLPGASLFLSTSHDDMSSRVKLSEKISAKELIIPAEGKTRSRIIDRRDFVKLFALCDALSCVAMRNHVLEGQSIPTHDHFHVFPSEIIPESFVLSIIGSESKLPLFEAKGTPFSTLCVTGSTPDEIASIATSILQRMEEQNEVYTLAYAYRHLFISSRWSKKIGSMPVRIGCGLPLHYFDPSNRYFLALILKYCPLAGEYRWGRFLT